jgi:hypothetical protein
MADLQIQCVSRKIPFFAKQLGAKPFFNGKPLKLNDKAGRDMSEWPNPGEWRRELPGG